MNKRFITLGLICLLLAFTVYTLPASANIDNQTLEIALDIVPDGYEEWRLNIPDEVDDGHKTVDEYLRSLDRLNNPYNGTVSDEVPWDVGLDIPYTPRGDDPQYWTDVQIISSYLNNPIHPALLDENNIIYNDIDFYIYTHTSWEYRISIYMNSVDDPIVMEGKTMFKAVENFQVPEGAKKIKKIVILVGPHKYEWENIKIMHKAIDEETIYVSPEMEVTRRQMWLKTIQSFIAGLFAAVAFSFGFWQYWKHHLETEIQDVI